MQGDRNVIGAAILDCDLTTLIIIWAIGVYRIWEADGDNIRVEGEVKDIGVESDLAGHGRG